MLHGSQTFITVLGELKWLTGRASSPYVHQGALIPVLQDPSHLYFCLAYRL